jgi:hypothetical protein
MAHGVTFAYCCQSEFGVEQAKRNETGYEVLCIPYVDVPIQTGNGNSWAWGVPVTSEEPEAAVAFMNLMFTNKEIENLFVYGIEGRDYELNEDGEACLLPDTKEYQSADFYWGNQFIAYPAEGSGSEAFGSILLRTMHGLHPRERYDPVTPAASGMSVPFFPGLSELLLPSCGRYGDPQKRSLFRCTLAPGKGPGAELLYEKKGAFHPPCAGIRRASVRSAKTSCSNIRYAGIHCAGIPRPNLPAVL